MSMREDAIKELARRELARRQQSQGAQGKPNIVEEQHDDVSMWDRFKLKNFSQSPEASAKYLAENNPNLETQAADGRVLVRSKGENQWKVLDPDTGAFSTDIIQDIGDVVYDVGAGAVEAISGIGSGVATANPLVGLAAAGAVGAGSEAVRQGAGKMLGIDNEVGEATTDTLTAGAISAAIPGLGKLAKPLIKGASKAGKGTVQKLTQATGEDINAFVNNGDQLDKILKSDTGFTDTFNAINRDVAEKEKLFKKAISAEYDKLRASGVAVDNSTAKEIYDEKLGELAEVVARGGSDSDKALLESVKKERDSLFSRGDVKSTTNEALATGGQSGARLDIPERMDINDALNLRQKLSARANFKNKSDLSKSLDSSSLSEGLAARGYGELGKSIDNVAEQIGSKQAREQFKDHINFVGDIAKHFKSPESLETFLKAANKGNRKTVAEKLARIDKRFGTDIAEKSNLVSTAQALKGSAEGSLTDIVRPKSAMELLGGAVGAKAAWASGQPWLIPFTLTAGAAVGRKLGSVKAARRYVDFIVDTEGKALKLDKAAKDILKKKLYRSVTGEDAIRGVVTGAAVGTRGRE